VTPRRWAYVVAGLCAASIADDLLRIPVQVFDALEEILTASRSHGLLDTFIRNTFQAHYLRPLRIVQIEALYDVAQGHYWLAYRGFHAALLVCAVLLFTRALRVRTRTDLFAAAFALAVLTGLHTFKGTIQEAFPINHFLEMAVFALATLNLCQGRQTVWSGLASLMLFCAAALTLESGVLVWVVAVSARAFGWRGLSDRTLGTMTALLVGYFVLRSVAVGMPTMAERGSGYFFEMLEPSEVIARFGEHVWQFRVYNVVVSLLSVLFSEPQNGVFVLVRSIRDGHVPIGLWIGLVTSVLTTGLILAHPARGLRRGAAGEPHEADSLLGIAAAVLVASAVISFTYTKDDIMSTAGMFYALAAYAAVRGWSARLESMRAATRALVVLVLFVTAAGWSIRSLGIHHTARSAAFKTRNDWAFQPVRWKGEGRWPASPAEQRLLGQLRAEALAMPTPNPRFRPAWMDELWGE
jgi:hypothetical protein